MERTGLLAPGIGSVPKNHWYCSGALPEAPTLRVAVSPRATPVSRGSDVMEGLVPGVIMLILSMSKVVSPPCGLLLMNASSIAVAVATKGLLRTSR